MSPARGVWPRTAWLAAACSSIFACAALGADPAAEESSRFVRSGLRDGYTSFETGTRFYRRADGSGVTVALVGVVHIGDRGYYERLVELLQRQDLVLYESVLPRGAFGTGGADDRARQRSTQDAMLFLKRLIAEFAIANGAVPSSIAELRAFIVGRDTRLARPIDLAAIDGWGRTVSYERTSAHAFRLASLGSDGRQGGCDFALDLVLRQLSPATIDKVVKSATGASGGDSDERRDLYGELASALDTSLQVRSIDYDRASWVPADLPMEELLDRLWKRGERSATIEMLSNQNGLQQGLVRFLLSIVSKSPTFKKMVIEALGGAGEAAGKRGRGGLGSVDERIILDERNDAVIEQLRAVLAAKNPPRSVAIFYGAAHMGDFESTLRSEFGLEPAEQHWFRAMAAESWDAKRINARIAKLEQERNGLVAADPDGAYPAASQLDTRLAELRERLAAVEAKSSSLK